MMFLKAQGEGCRWRRWYLHKEKYIARALLPVNFLPATKLTGSRCECCVVLVGPVTVYEDPGGIYKGSVTGRHAQTRVKAGTMTCPR